MSTFDERFPTDNWTMGEAAASDSYPDAFEAAASRVARPYQAVQQRAGTSNMEALGEAVWPKEPWQYAAMFAAPGSSLIGRGIQALPLAARSIAAGAGMMLSGVPMYDTNEAQGGVLDKATKAAAQFVRDPQRVFAPGIYKDPRVIAAEAAANVAPEHPALKQLFGVTRDDLWEMGGRGTRQGNMEPTFSGAAVNPKGSYKAEAIMTPQNAQRMVDTLGEAERYPQLTRGMDAWYVMDPAFQRMVQLVGYDQAVRDYNRFNTVTSMFSPGSAVQTEINRGTAANMMIERGEWPKFLKYGGMAEDSRGRGFPAALRDVIGHPYHSTAQAGPVDRYLQSGVVDMTQPKVPL